MIELLTHSGNDHTISSAARVSFGDSSNWGQVPDGYTEDRSYKLIQYLAEHKHLCVFRHNLITIRCEAPIFLARQLSKHQAGLTWSEVSRRYVATEPRFHYPDSWRKKPDGNIKQGSAGVHDRNAYWSDRYERQVETMRDMYHEMIDDGIAPEQARMILPQSMLTMWIWSGNLLSFAHIYLERIAKNAQLEAQVFAKDLDQIIRSIFPIAWAALADGDQ